MKKIILLGVLVLGFPLLVLPRGLWGLKPVRSVMRQNIIILSNFRKKPKAMSI